ncbi:CinA family protein [soil metagenome]
MFPPAIETLARSVIAAATARGVMIATVESCTGGLVAAALTAVPGSSAVLDRGFVTYSNVAKTDLVGVPATLIDRHGAVSEPVARAMAEGAVARSPATLAVSVTGIAGPGGGSADKPVGLVHFGVAGLGDTAAVHRHFANLDRDGVRLASVETALGLLAERLGA